MSAPPDNATSSPGSSEGPLRLRLRPSDGMRLWTGCGQTVPWVEHTQPFDLGKSGSLRAFHPSPAEYDAVLQVGVQYPRPARQHVGGCKAVLTAHGCACARGTRHQQLLSILLLHLSTGRISGGWRRRNRTNIKNLRRRLLPTRRTRRDAATGVKPCRRKAHIWRPLQPCRRLEASARWTARQMRLRPPETGGFLLVKPQLCSPGQWDRPPTLRVDGAASPFGWVHVARPKHPNARATCLALDSLLTRHHHPYNKNASPIPRQRPHRLSLPQGGLPVMPSIAPAPDHVSHPMTLLQSGLHLLRTAPVGSQT